MASRKQGGKLKPGANIDFTPIVPKFLQGRMEGSNKRREDDDLERETGDEITKKALEGKERPEMEDEAPTIVADDDIMALLEKQQVVVGDGKLEFKGEQTVEPKAQNDDSIVEFGAKPRSKKVATVARNNPDSTIEKAVDDKNTKKRPASADAEASNPVKRAEKKKMLSFDDEEDL